MSTKRNDSNEIRKLRTQVQDLQEQHEAMATAFFNLYEMTNSLYGQLVIRGVLPDPAVEASPFIRSGSETVADNSSAEEDSK